MPVEYSRSWLLENSKMPLFEVLHGELSGMHIGVSIQGDFYLESAGEISNGIITSGNAFWADSPAKCFDLWWEAMQNLGPGESYKVKDKRYKLIQGILVEVESA